MSISIIAFVVLVAAFAWGSVTAVNAGLIAVVAAYIVGPLLGGMTVSAVTAQFPAGLFFILFGATLLFSIVRVTGTIDLMAVWAERMSQGKRLRVPVLMFALTAVLATAGAFTPAAIAIVAPVALALGARFGISTLATGLVVVQGANAGAFSPVNPFGIVSNGMLAKAGAADNSLWLYLYCFAFNAVVAMIAYTLVQWWSSRSASADAVEGVVTEEEQAHLSADLAGGPAKPNGIQTLALLGILSLLVLTLGFSLDVGVAALIASLVLIAIRPSIQKPALAEVPWSAIILVTGIVTYVGVLEEIGAIAELQAGIATFGSSSIATLVTSYVVGLVSAFASTTGTLSAITPLVVPLATDPAVSALGVVTAISIASSVVDVSPMSTSGALLMASAHPRDEAFFFRALLIYAIAMIVMVPLVVWLIFVASGVF
jgi:Na+/H+ antiporter NhaD/arsenite permease-like protein